MPHHFRNFRLLHLGADADHPTHVVPMVGATSGALTTALEGITGSGLSKTWVKKQATEVLKLFDFFLDERRCIDAISPPSTIVAGFRAYLKSLNFTSAMQKPNRWYSVEGPRELHDAVSALLAGFSRAYDTLVERGYYPYAHPGLLSEEAMREQRLRAKHSGRKGGRRGALGNTLFRLTSKVYSPPRRTQVKLVRNVLDWAIAAKWPESLLCYLRILIVSGCRPSDPSRFRLLDYYLASRCELAVESCDKNSPDQVRKTIRFQKDEQEALHAYINGERFKAMPKEERRTVADIIRLGDAGDYNALQQPLLVNPQNRAWKYNTISRNWWKPLMQVNCIDPVTGRKPVRMPTMHWLRHLFVYDHLALIEQSSDLEAEKLRQKEVLAGYIGWNTGLAMLATYGREYEDRKVAQQMIGFMNRRAMMASLIKAGEVQWTATPSPSAPRHSAGLSRMLRDRSQKVAA